MSASRRAWRGLPSGALLVLLLLGTGPSCSEPPAAVGVLLPLEGVDAEQAAHLRRGIELAWDEALADERPPLLVADTGGTASGTALAFDGLVEQGARLVLGPLTTEEALVAGLSARRLRVPFLAPAATGEEAARDNRWAFRYCYGDDRAARLLAEWAVDRLGLVRVAVVIDLSSRESMGLAEAFAREVQLKLGRIVGELGYHQGGQAVVSVLDRALALEADGVLVAGRSVDLAAMVRASRDPGLAEVVLLGAAGWDGEALPALLAGRVAGAYHVSHFSAEEDGEPHRRLAAGLARDGLRPEDFAALGYDAARAVLSVFDAGADGNTLRERLHQLREVPGATGLVTMDRGGRPIAKSMVLEQLHDPDAPRLVGRMEP